MRLLSVKKKEYGAEYLIHIIYIYINFYKNTEKAPLKEDNLSFFIHRWQQLLKSIVVIDENNPF